MGDGNEPRCQHLVGRAEGVRCGAGQFVDVHDPLGWKYGDARYDEVHPFDPAPALIEDGIPIFRTAPAANMRRVCPLGFDAPAHRRHLAWTP